MLNIKGLNKPIDNYLKDNDIFNYIMLCFEMNIYNFHNNMDQLTFLFYYYDIFLYRSDRSLWEGTRTLLETTSLNILNNEDNPFLEYDCVLNDIDESYVERYILYDNDKTIHINENKSIRTILEFIDDPNIIKLVNNSPNSKTSEHIKSLNDIIFKSPELIPNYDNKEYDKIINNNFIKLQSTYKNRIYHCFKIIFDKTKYKLTQHISYNLFTKPELKFYQMFDFELGDEDYKESKNTKSKHKKRIESNLTKLNIYYTYKSLQDVLKNINSDTNFMAYRKKTYCKKEDNKYNESEWFTT